MRFTVCFCLIAGAVAPAFAADFDSALLRGSAIPYADPPNYQRWSGFYGGGQIGADFHGVDFRNVVGDSIATISAMDSNFNGIPLSNFPHLSSMNTTGPSYGVFVGYNYQIDDVVMGFELNFNKSSLNASLSDPESHNYFTSANGTLYDAKYNVNTTASASVADYGTVRGRLGWAYGSFLPYVFLGTSIAQINTSRSVNVNYCGQESPYTCTNPPPPAVPPPPAPIGGTFTQTDVSHGKWVFGWDIGMGIDYAITKNIFIRGEFEYLQLGSPNDIKINTTSVRAGLGLKF